MVAANIGGPEEGARRTSLSWWRAVWWSALGAMALNDHVLKTAGVLPGWFTGKLSDFAGLIVAPVLLAMLTRARRATGRAVCFVSVISLFVAIKVSAAAAQSVVAAMSWLGISWRLWTDPADLVALAVLPLAWHIDALRAHALAAAQAEPRRAIGFRDTLGVIAGAAACLATSAEIPEPYRTAAFLANVTEESTSVEIFRARAPLDCAALAADAATALAAAPFDPEACWQLEGSAVVPLARNWVLLRNDQVIGGPGGPAPPCDAVVVRVQRQQQALLSWQAIADVQVSPSDDFASDSNLDPHGMYLERLRERIYLAASPLITSQPVTLALPAITSCHEPAPWNSDGGVP